MRRGANGWLPRRGWGTMEGWVVLCGGVYVCTRSGQFWHREIGVRRGSWRRPIGLSTGRWITAVRCWPSTRAMDGRWRCGPWWRCVALLGVLRVVMGRHGCCGLVAVRSRSLACYDRRHGSCPWWWMTSDGAQVQGANLVRASSSLCVVPFLPIGWWRQSELGSPGATELSGGSASKDTGVAACELA